MSPLFRAATVLLVFVTAACTTPEQRAAEQQAKEAQVQRLNDLGNYEECVGDAGEDTAKVEACSSLQPGPAPSQ